MRVVILVLVSLVLVVASSASQDVVVPWAEVRFSGALDLAGYASITIIARSATRGDVSYIENLSISVDGTKISCPKEAFSDLPFPSLGALEITYPFSHEADAEGLIYLTIPYVLPDPNSTESVKARFTIDLKGKRVVERNVVFPDSAGKLQSRREKVPR